MVSLPSIPKRAIISIQPDPMSPFEFMNVNDAKEMLNSRHVGGIKRRTNSKTVRRNKRSGGGCNLVIANACGINPGPCGNKLRGGKPTGRNAKRRKTKRSMKDI